MGLVIKSTIILSYQDLNIVCYRLKTTLHGSLIARAMLRHGIWLAMLAVVYGSSVEYHHKGGRYREHGYKKHYVYYGKYGGEFPEFCRKV